MSGFSPRDVDRMYCPFAETEKETISEEWAYKLVRYEYKRNRRYVCFIDDFICLEIVGFDYFELGRFLDCVVQELRVLRVGYKTSILPSTNKIARLLTFMAFKS